MHQKKRLLPEAFMLSATVVILSVIRNLARKPHPMRVWTGLPV